VSLFETQKHHREGQLSKDDFIVEMSKMHGILFEYAEFIQHTDVLAIDIANGQVVFTLKGPGAGIRMVCDSVDQRMVPLEILNFDTYEQVDFNLVSRLLEDGQTVMDIGANIGWYTLQIAATFPTTKVLAFEPIPNTYNYLRRNVELNQAVNVMIHNFGFWNKTDTLTFYFYPEGSGNASIANVAEKKDARQIRCPVTRLDDFVIEHDLRIDFIKCDVEGAEKYVFEGATQTIRRDMPIVYTEMLRKWSAKFNYHPNQIIEFFSDLGYRCYVARNGFLNEFLIMDDTTPQTNFFFLHPQHHMRKLNDLVQP
jgi:FkbM family methyltransferase